MSSHLDRRTIVKGGLGAGLAWSLSPAAVVQDVVQDIVQDIVQDHPAAARPKAGDLLIRVDDAALKPLRADDIPVGMTQVMAWAMDQADRIVRSGSRLNRVMLLRLDEATLAAGTKTRAAAGVVAYSAICPHTGCDVTDWLPEETMILCPCHFSKFDPRDSAGVIDGPAPRPLPSLPLRIADGQLVVAAPFTARVTFDPA